MGIKLEDKKLVERILKSPNEANKVMDEVGEKEYFRLVKLARILKTKSERFRKEK